MSEINEALKEHLAKLLGQIIKTCGMSDLMFIVPNPIWLEDEKYLVLTRNPHVSYEVWHTSIGWESDCIELERRLNHARVNRKNATEQWAVSFLQNLGYSIVDPQVASLELFREETQ